LNASWSHTVHGVKEAVSLYGARGRLTDEGVLLVEGQSAGPVQFALQLTAPGPITVGDAPGELASRLERTEEAATAGAVLHASWASHGALELPIPELGPEGALAFARKAEGLYARYYARSRQLQAERVAVRRLLDVLIERQLARRLDTLFAGDDGLGLSALLAGEGKSEDWGDLGTVVGRALGLPASGGSVIAGSGASLDQIQHFARGGHRE